MGRKPARGLLIVAVFALLAALSITDGYIVRHAFPSERPPAKSLSVVFWASLRYYLAWAVVSPGIFWLGRRVPVATRRWGRALAFHFLVPVAGSVPFLVLVIGLAVLAGQALPPAAYFFSHGLWLLLVVNLTLMPVYWLILGAATALQVYRDREANQLRAIELQRSLEAAELDALQMKLHPRFLFSTLDSVARLARDGETDAVGQVIERLGTLLRLSMDTSGRQLVTVEEELALLDEHLAIEEIRLKDRFHVVRRVDPASRCALVPNLILQPLVENAIAHGLSRRPEASLLEISIRRDGPDLRIAVRDDGPGLPAGWQFAVHARQGLRNVADRLQALYAPSFRFDIGNSATGGAVAELRFPFSEALPAPGGLVHGPH